MRTMLAILLLTSACAGDPVHHLPDAPQGDDGDDAAPDAPAARTCTTTAPGGIGGDGNCAWAFSCQAADSATTYGVFCNIDTVGFSCRCQLDGVDTGTPLTAVTDACMAATDMCSIANQGCGFATPITCPE